MRLTWRDGAATLLTAVAVAIYWALLAGADLPLVGGVRGAATAILLIGLATCITGSHQSGPLDSVSKVFGFFGAVAFFAGLTAIIWAAQWALAVEIGVIAALWAATTLRHALTTRAAERKHVKVG